MPDVGRPELWNYKSRDFRWTNEIGLHKNWIVLHKTVIPAGIMNLAWATTDHLIIEIAAPQFYNFYGA